MSPTTKEAATAARRAQIITATIDTVAEVGFARTTFAKIAERGRMSSTRLISYHFASKADLMQAVITDIYGSIDQFLLDRMATDPASRTISGRTESRKPPKATAAEELRAYITGVVAYIDTHHSRMRAIQSIFAALHDDADNPETLQTDPRSGVMQHIQNILRRGQRSGEFRAFDRIVIATMIQRPLEALPQLLRSRPNLDLTKYAAELATAVDLATRNLGSGDPRMGVSD